MGKRTHCALVSHLAPALAFVVIFLLCVLTDQLSRGANWCHILWSLQCARVTGFSASEPLHVSSVAGFECCGEIWSKSDSHLGNAYCVYIHRSIELDMVRLYQVLFPILVTWRWLSSPLPGVFPAWAFPLWGTLGWLVLWGQQHWERLCMSDVATKW